MMIPLSKEWWGVRFVTYQYNVEALWRRKALQQILRALDFRVIFLPQLSFETLEAEVDCSSKNTTKTKRIYVFG